MNAHHLSKDIQLNFHTLVDRVVARVRVAQVGPVRLQVGVDEHAAKATPGRTAWPKPLFDWK